MVLCFAGLYYLARFLFLLLYGPLMSSCVVIVSEGKTYGGLFVKSVFNNTGTRVISLTSWT